MMKASESHRLILEGRSARGESDALELLFEEAEPRLAKIARFWLPAELKHRVSVVDLLSVARVRTMQRQSKFAIEARSSSFLWFREILLQAIEHLRLRIAPRCEGHVSLRSVVVDGLGIDSPNQFTDDDIHILFLRHFEELTNEETAIVMGVVSRGLSIRYLRILSQMGDAETFGEHLGNVEGEI